MKLRIFALALVATSGQAMALQDETAEAAHMMWAQDNCNQPVMQEDWWKVRLAALRTFSRSQGGGGLIAKARRDLEGAMLSLTNEQACKQVITGLERMKAEREASK